MHPKYQKYQKVLSNLKFSKKDQQIIEAVKQGIQSDQQKSPFDNNKWYMKFAQENQDGLLFSQAPKNKPLMVVTESFGTIYTQERGSQISRGSIIVKLEDDLIYCLDAYTWGIVGTKAVIYPQNGFFEIIERWGTQGGLKVISKVNV